jgi:hypothetical protein
MDILIRGLCEQYIDCKLEESELQEVRDLFDNINIPISKNDVLLGFFLGAANSQLKNLSMTVYNRAPEPTELESYQRILVRRFPEIMAKINSQIPADEEGSDVVTLDDGKNSQGEQQPIVIEATESEAEGTIVSEIELNPVATIDDSVASAESMKFSFQSRTNNKPVTTVLGIPIKK